MWVVRKFRTSEKGECKHKGPTERSKDNERVREGEQERESKRERAREREQERKKKVFLSEYYHVTIMNHCTACKGGARDHASFRFNTDA